MEELSSSDPKTVGRWRLLGRLGKGGMGRVYFAIDSSKSINNEVALKIIRSSALEESGARARLSREVNSLNSIASNYVARIVDSDISGSPAWIATEKINGPSLAQYVKEHGPLDELNWFALAFGIFSALDEIHRLGIIHRDIKPSNILVEFQAGQVIPKIIDFGIAVDNESTSITRTGILIGTPAWLAPEQFTGNQVTAAVDVFASGAVLHFAATGKNPWGIEDTTPIATVIGAITAGRAELSEIKDSRKELLSNLLEADPKLRLTTREAFQSIYKLMIDGGIDIIRLSDPPEGVAPRVKRRKRRRNLLKPLIASSLLISLIATLLLFVRTSEPLEAQLKIAISSSYLSSICKGISGLEGIENSSVQIEDLDTKEKFNLGKLDSGVKRGSETCEYYFSFQQMSDVNAVYGLSIRLPWENYVENFKFEKDETGIWVFNLALALE